MTCRFSSKVDEPFSKGTAEAMVGFPGEWVKAIIRDYKGSGGYRWGYEVIRLQTRDEVW